MLVSSLILDVNLVMSLYSCIVNNVKVVSDRLVLVNTSNVPCVSSTNADFLVRDIVVLSLE